MVYWNSPSARRIRWSAFVTVLLGVFAALFGAGSRMWWISGGGGALLAAAAVLAIVGVVVERNAMVVAGQAYVTDVSPPPVAQRTGRCHMRLSVQAPGLPTTSVVVRDSGVPVEKWPVVGAVLPVRVAHRNPRRLRVRWDEVPAFRFDDLDDAYLDAYLDDAHLDDDDGGPVYTSSGS